jgi:F0F1-type ATP synthase membrane subunit b/b'
MENFFMYGFFSLIGVILVLYFVGKKVIEKKNQNIDDLHELNSSLEKEKEDIKNYYDQIIPKAETRGEEIITAAEKKAESIISNSNEEAEMTISDSRYKARTIIERSYKIAKEISDEAYKNASDLSKDVFKNLSKKEELEKTIEAYKNIINDYDSDFSFKESIILDELAEIYSYTKAGENLKNARQFTKELIDNKKAAVSDYVEDNRKETAIDFILYAFNGKVDTIMNKIRVDNYDRLKQKIEDAFYLLNNLGSAFRDTKITKEFLEARLEELKWGHVISEIKKKEKEEQRRIREEIREEEKARKEREKAIADAEKEEKLIEDTMKKVREEMEQATEEQKKEFEDKLLQMQKELEEAKEKNQRAISLAQQTKAGHVYIISNIGSFGENVYKIGMTRRLNPEDRVNELGSASVPFPFDIHAMIYSENAPQLEYELHQIFNDQQMNKINSRKEFFRVNIKDIREEIEKRELPVQWTMKAQAAEYRESLELSKMEGKKEELVE